MTSELTLKGILFYQALNLSNTVALGCAHTRRKFVRARFIVTKHAPIRLRLVRAHVFTDLYEKLVDDSLLSYS